MKFNLNYINEKNLTPQIAKILGSIIGIDWEKVDYYPDDLFDGMLVEYEHGSKDKVTNVTNDDPIQTAKIALAHLNENPMYYSILKKQNL